MKLNELHIRRYNTGYRVEITVWAPVRSQFTKAMITGEGLDLNLLKAVRSAWRDVLAQRRALNVIPYS